jgi:16S rRNA (cytosine1402-N4)-methyltransferase
VGEHAYAHVPVLAGRVTALLVPALAGPGPDGGPRVLVDATLGRAGHARALLEACPGLLLIGIDADEAAIEYGRALAAEYPGQVTLAHAFYDQIAEIVGRAGHRRVQGVLFDLGVSSPQLDDTSRGFSYAHDAPLDMRMDRSAGTTAERVVNDYPVRDLARVLAEYGEERFARRIAEAVVRERARERVTTTLRLSDIVKDAIPGAARRPGGNPS